MLCRHCKHTLKHSFLDLGFAPPSNAYLKKEDLTKPEVYYPLRIKVCDHCWLVQTEDYTRADELFNSEYAYFSSTSTSWLAHAKTYVDDVTKRLDLDSSSFVIEVASNDGYLLKNFVEREVPCLGIEPTESTARAARKLGVSTLQEFFGVRLASILVEEGQQADLIIGNNVFAHVPDINDFTAGLKMALKPGGTVTLEFPHLLQLISNNQFDTIYHEHYSYLSLHSVQKIFESVGLKVYDIEEIPTHGGSLRVFGCHDNDLKVQSEAVFKVIKMEELYGLLELNTYLEFQERAETIKMEFISFLLNAKKEGKTVTGYGAAAKGNTLLNFAGIKPDLVPSVSDASASKQGMYLPGSHIPIMEPEIIKELKPDYIVIFPWNIKQEVMDQLAFVRQWQSKFVVFVPEMKIS